MKEVTDQLESTQINDDNHEVDDGNKEQNVDANQIGNSDEDPTNSLLLPVNLNLKNRKKRKKTYNNNHNNHNNNWHLYNKNQHQFNLLSMQL